ncbi:MAG: nitroreductase/quinone reductase family protein [Marmoricola sp.]
MSALMKTLMSKGNAMHVALYRRTGGRHFNRIKGLPVCLLTVPGRKTGTPRTTPIVYFERAGTWLVVGSAGGAKADPQWFRNLRMADRATLEIGDREHGVSVHITAGEERDALWAWVVEQAPFFDGYRKKSGRTIPIAVLTRTT